MSLTPIDWDTRLCLAWFGTSRDFMSSEREKAKSMVRVLTDDDSLSPFKCGKVQGIENQCPNFTPSESESETLSKPITRFLLDFACNFLNSILDFYAVRPRAGLADMQRNEGEEADVRLKKPTNLGGNDFH